MGDATFQWERQLVHRFVRFATGALLQHVHVTLDWSVELDAWIGGKRRKSWRIVIASLPTSRPSRDRHRFYRKRKCTVRGIETGANNVRRRWSTHGSREIRDVNQWRTVDVRVEPPLRLHILACAMAGTAINTTLLAMRVRSTRRKKKTALLILLLLKLTMRANCANAKARKPRAVLVGKDTLRCHLRHTLQIYGHVACLNKWTRWHERQTTGWKRRENLGTRIVQAHPDRRVAQSSGTDPMADDEPRHCLFPSYTPGRRFVVPCFSLIKVQHKSLVDNVRIVWKQFGTRVFFFKIDDKEVRSRQLLFF